MRAVCQLLVVCPAVLSTAHVLKPALHARNEDIRKFNDLISLLENESKQLREHETAGDQQSSRLSELTENLKTEVSTANDAVAEMLQGAPAVATALRTEGPSAALRVIKEGSHMHGSKAESESIESTLGSLDNIIEGSDLPPSTSIGMFQESTKLSTGRLDGSTGLKAVQDSSTSALKINNHGLAVSGEQQTSQTQAERTNRTRSQVEVGSETMVTRAKSERVRDPAALDDLLKFFHSGGNSNGFTNAAHVGAGSPTHNGEKPGSSSVERVLGRAESVVRKTSDVLTNSHNEDLSADNTKISLQQQKSQYEAPRYPTEASLGNAHNSNGNGNANVAVNTVIANGANPSNKVGKLSWGERVWDRLEKQEQERSKANLALEEEHMKRSTTEWGLKNGMKVSQTLSASAVAPSSTQMSMMSKHEMHRNTAQTATEGEMNVSDTSKRLAEAISSLDIPSAGRVPVRVPQSSASVATGTGSASLGSVLSAARGSVKSEESAAERLQSQIQRAVEKAVLDRELGGSSGSSSSSNLSGVALGSIPSPKSQVLNVQTGAQNSGLSAGLGNLKLDTDLLEKLASKVPEALAEQETRDQLLRAEASLADQSLQVGPGPASQQQSVSQAAAGYLSSALNSVVGSGNHGGIASQEDFDRKLAEEKSKLEAKLEAEYRAKTERYEAELDAKLESKLESKLDAKLEKKVREHVDKKLDQVASGVAEGIESAAGSLPGSLAGGNSGAKEDQTWSNLDKAEEEARLALRDQHESHEFERDSAEKGELLNFRRERQARSSLEKEIAREREILDREGKSSDHDAREGDLAEEDAEGQLRAAKSKLRKWKSKEGKAKRKSHRQEDSEEEHEHESEEESEHESSHKRHSNREEEEVVGEKTTVKRGKKDKFHDAEVDLLKKMTEDEEATRRLIEKLESNSKKAKGESMSLGEKSASYKSSSDKVSSEKSSSDKSSSESDAELSQILKKEGSESEESKSSSPEVGESSMMTHELQDLQHQLSSVASLGGGDDNEDLKASLTKMLESDDDKAGSTIALGSSTGSSTGSKGESVPVSALQVSAHEVKGGKKASVEGDFETERRGIETSNTEDLLVEKLETMGDEQRPENDPSVSPVVIEPTTASSAVESHQNQKTKSTTPTKKATSHITAAEITSKKSSSKKSGSTVKKASKKTPTPSPVDMSDITSITGPSSTDEQIEKLVSGDIEEHEERLLTEAFVDKGSREAQAAALAASREDELVLRAAQRLHNERTELVRKETGVDPSSVESFKGKKVDVVTGERVHVVPVGAGDVSEAERKYGVKGPESEEEAVETAKREMREIGLDTGAATGDLPASSGLEKFEKDRLASKAEKGLGESGSSISGFGGASEEVKTVRKAEKVAKTALRKENQDLDETKESSKKKSTATVEAKLEATTEIKGEKPSASSPVHIDIKPDAHKAAESKSEPKSTLSAQTKARLKDNVDMVSQMSNHLKRAMDAIGALAPEFAKKKAQTAVSASNTKIQATTQTGASAAAPGQGNAVNGVLSATETVVKKDNEKVSSTGKTTAIDHARSALESAELSEGGESQTGQTEESAASVLARARRHEEKLLGAAAASEPSVAKLTSQQAEAIAENSEEADIVSSVEEAKRREVKRMMREERTEASKQVQDSKDEAFLETKGKKHAKEGSQGEATAEEKNVQITDVSESDVAAKETATETQTASKSGNPNVANAVAVPTTSVAPKKAESGASVVEKHFEGQAEADKIVSEAGKGYLVSTVQNGPATTEKRGLGDDNKTEKHSKSKMGWGCI